MKRYILFFSFSLLLFPLPMVAPGRFTYTDDGKLVATSSNPIVYQPDSLKNVCFNRCMKIIEDDEEVLPIETFNDLWVNKLPQELRREFIRKVIRAHYGKAIDQGIEILEKERESIEKSFQKDRHSRNYARGLFLQREEFEALFKRLFEKQLVGLSLSFVKSLRSIFFFEADHADAKDILRNLVLELSESEEEKNFINTYFQIWHDSRLLLYEKDPYYIAFTQRNFPMMDHLLTMGISYRKKYKVGNKGGGGSEGLNVLFRPLVWEPVFKPLLDILKDETDLHDAQMKTYLTEKFGIHFD